MITMRVIQTPRWWACVVSMALAMGTQMACADNIRYGLVTPEGHVWSGMMQQFHDRVETGSGQTLHLKESRQVRQRGESAVLEMLASNQIQMALVSVGALTTLDPALNSWLMPYQFADIAAAERMANTEIGQSMLASLENYNVVGIGYAFAGMRQILSKEPIVSLADFKDKQLTSYPNDVFYNWYRRLGASPKVVPVQDMLVKLENGQLDAIDCDLGTLAGLDFGKVAPNLLLTHHMASVGILVVSKNWWGTLGADRQALIRDSYASANAWGQEQLVQHERDHLQRLRDQGVKVKELREADFAGVPQQLREFYYSTNNRIKAFGELAADHN